MANHESPYNVRLRYYIDSTQTVPSFTRIDPEVRAYIIWMEQYIEKIEDLKRQQELNGTPK